MSEENNDTGVHTEAAAPVDSAPSESQASGSEEAKNVPLEALQAERAQRQSLQEELHVIKDHLSLLQANQTQPKPVAENEPSDDDVMTYGDLKKALNSKERQLKVTLDELKIMQKNPDYEEVVTKYLPEVLNTNPGLRKTLQESQDYELAYYLAKNSDAYKAQNKGKKRNADAERIVQNSQEAGSLSSVGSNSPVNQSRRFKDMADEDFSKMVSKNLGYR